MSKNRYSKGQHQQQKGGSNYYNQRMFDELEDHVQGACNAKTNLIQVYTREPSEGPRLISQEHPQGVPMMVMVDNPCCCYCKLNVPHGIVSLEQKCGEQQGLLEPGFYCCYCRYKKIAAMITKNTIRFNTPVERCPTKDNVRVTIDVSINFHIGEEETRLQDCEKFLYTLGPNRLQEMLEQECAERVRLLVRKHEVRRLRDLKSEMAHEILEDLAKSFQALGVYFESVVIMKVIMPKDLRFALSDTTTQDVKLQNQIKYFENRKLLSYNNENMELLKLKRRNMMTLDALNHRKELTLIQMENIKIRAYNDQKLKVINVEEDRSVQLIKARAVKEQAEKRAQKIKEELLAEAEVYATQKRIDADNIASILEKQAENRENCSEFQSKALTLEAMAEEQQSANLTNKRKHEERILLAENTKDVMRRNKIVVAGQTGEEFLNYVKETIDQVKQKD